MLTLSLHENKIYYYYYYYFQGNSDLYSRDECGIINHGNCVQIKLSDIEAIELLDKRGYLTICITLAREGKVYLRRADGIRDWYEAVRENMRERRRIVTTTPWQNLRKT
jgi:hypothetical protein